MTRPDRDVVLTLLANRMKTVTITEHVFVEDVDGIPLGVENETSTAVLVVSPEILGWTWDELGVDPEDYP